MSYIIIFNYYITYLNHQIIPQFWLNQTHWIDPKSESNCFSNGLFEMVFVLELFNILELSWVAFLWLDDMNVFISMPTPWLLVSTELRILSPPPLNLLAFETLRFSYLDTSPKLISYLFYFMTYSLRRSSMTVVGSVKSTLELPWILETCDVFFFIGLFGLCVVSVYKFSLIIEFAGVNL